MNIQYTSDANLHLSRLVEEDKRAALKFFELVEDILRTPYTGKGRPEALRHELSGWWSRQISEKHRLVYKIDEPNDSLIILRCYGHYGDK
jgi:toxin YoeB